MAAKLTRLTHKITIQLHLVAERCAICSSRSRRPVRKQRRTTRYNCNMKLKRNNFMEGTNTLCTPMTAHKYTTFVGVTIRVPYSHLSICMSLYWHKNLACITKVRIRGPFEKFVDWRQCVAIMQMGAVNVMPSCSGGSNVVVAWSSSL
jgi:hypothetical protein